MLLTILCSHYIIATIFLEYFFSHLNIPSKTINSLRTRIRSIVYSKFLLSCTKVSTKSRYSEWIFILVRSPYFDKRGKQQWWWKCKVKMEIYDHKAMEKLTSCQLCCTFRYDCQIVLLGLNEIWLPSYLKTIAQH